MLLTPFLLHSYLISFVLCSILTRPPPYLSIFLLPCIPILLPPSFCSYPFFVSPLFLLLSYHLIEITRYLKLICTLLGASRARSHPPLLPPLLSSRVSQYNRAMYNRRHKRPLIYLDRLSSALCCLILPHHMRSSILTSILILPIPIYFDLSLNISGAVCLEIFKLLQNKPLTAFANTFTSLGVNLFTSMEPQPPNTTTSLVKGKEWKWTQVCECVYVCIYVCGCVCVFVCVCGLVLINKSLHNLFFDGSNNFFF